MDCDWSQVWPMGDMTEKEACEVITTTSFYSKSSPFPQEVSFLPFFLPCLRSGPQEPRSTQHTEKTWELFQTPPPSFPRLLPIILDFTQFIAACAALVQALSISHLPQLFIWN